MSQDLATENQKLRRQLQGFLDEARNNEEKMRRFHRQELLLLGSSSLGELIELLLYQTCSSFGLDIITLSLFDPEYEFTRILEASGKFPHEISELIIEPDSRNLNYLYKANYQPRLGSFRENDHGMLFPAPLTRPCCVALLPLVQQGKLIGSLNLGSSDSERYRHDSGTEFLNRLAVVVAIALGNILNQERLKLIGLTDPLTRVNNRRFFDQRLAEVVAAASRYDQPLVCMFLDIDHFKRINDSLGHQAGDVVLSQFAALIAQQFRRHDILCRYGGEEFVALLPNTSIEVAYDIAERCRGLVAAHAFKLNDDGHCRVTISIGVAALDCQPLSEIDSAAHSLVATADGAVYRAKERGRNCVVVADLLDRHTLAQLA